MTEQNAVRQFAELLAREDDPARRAALVKRAQMIAMNELPAEAFEPPVQTLGEYLDTPIEIPPSLVWPTICVRGEVTATLGRGGKGKTTMNQNRIFKWAAGRPMFDSFKNPKDEVYLRPENPLKALIIENEGAAGMFHHKLGTMLNNCEGILTDEDRDAIRENISIWGTGGYSGLKLDDPGIVSQVRAGVEKAEPDIVFIEPFRSLWRGEENSSTDMANVVDNLIGIGTDYNCAIILSHHERKGAPGEGGDDMDRARGSTVLEGAVAVMENFASTKNGDYRELSWSKARYLQPPPTVRFEYDPDTGWYRHVAEGELENQIIEVLRSADEPLNLAALAEATDESQAKLRRSCNKMADDGRLKKMASSYSGDGSTGIRYRLPSEDNDDEGTGGLSVA